MTEEVRTGLRRGFVGELVKLGFDAPTGSSRNPFRAVLNRAKKVLFRDDLQKTMGPKEYRSPVFPSMEAVANRGYQQKPRRV